MLPPIWALVLRVAFVCWWSNWITSSSPSYTSSAPAGLLCRSSFSVSNPILLKSINIFADLIAYFCFLAMTNILKDCAMLQTIRRSSSLISSDCVLAEIMVIKNSRLHPKTIAKSNLFQLLFLMYFLKPAIRILNPKSTLMVMLSRSSTAMKVGELAILKPSMIVVTTKRIPVIRRPM